MTDLHPIQCACADCRNRRLVSSWDVAAEGCRANDLEEFGFVRQGEAPHRADDEPLVRAGAK